MNAQEQLQNAYKSIEARLPFKPRVALILGSGLGDFAEGTKQVCTIPYGEIAGFPVSTAPGHKGQFVFAEVAGVPTVIMQGRVHYYEGYSMQDVVLGTRLMGKMGAEILLIGINDDRLGPRFPDMCEIYRKDLCAAIEAVAARENIGLQKGVYMQLTGPAFESPAEVKMCRALGADAVGMSTACEAVAANHMGMRVCGISCISNLAAGMTGNALTAEEVKETADRVSGDFTRLVTGAIAAF